MRAGILLASLLLSGCIDPPARDDQLDLAGAQAAVGDGGLAAVDLPTAGALPPEEYEPLPAPTIGHETCHDACGGVCGTDEACCKSTSQCIRLECRECCPDADFGFDELRAGPR
jgi:hypothetical protein